MAIGDVHTETGWLVLKGNETVLLRDGGGVYRLDGWSRTEPYIGLHVQIVGRRSGFDMIDVAMITESILPPQ